MPQIQSKGPIRQHAEFRVRKFGSNPSTNTEELVWRASFAYKFQQTPEPIEVVSNALSDTAAGLGAREVIVQGLNEDWDLIEETIPLNGTTPVQGERTDWLRVFRAYAGVTGEFFQDPGTAVGMNNGDLSISGVTSGFLLASIETGRGQTQHSLYTVPRGHTAYLDQYRVSVGVGSNSAGRFFMYQRRNNADLTVSPWASPRLVVSTGIVTESIEAMANFADRFPERTDIFWTAEKTGTHQIEADVEYELVVYPNQGGKL